MKIKFILLLQLIILHSSFALSWKKNHDPLFFNYSHSNWHRTLIHFHNIFSHDACDGKPQKDKIINQQCLDRFKKQMCANHIDVIFITEHRNHLAFWDWNEMMKAYQLDYYEKENDQLIGGYFSCGIKSGGHKVYLYPGSENAIMPIGLKRHPEPAPGMDLEQTYNSLTYEAAKNMKEAGALIGINHLEEKRNTLEKVKAVKADFVEMYNSHANIESIYGKKNVFKISKFLTQVLGFLANPFVETDLYFLSFLKTHPITMAKWANLVQTSNIKGVMGADFHENVASLKLKDKERLDSYRRMCRWYSNYIYSPGASKGKKRKNMLEAIKQGHVLGVFEIFGSPDQFEFYGLDKMGNRISMGSSRSFEKDMKLIIKLPLNRPKYSWANIYKASENGWIKVFEGNYKSEKENIIEYNIKEKGVYRAEVELRATHLSKYMPSKIFLFFKKYPWIYTNPIFLR